MFVDTNVALFDHMALWTISNEACRINWCKYASSSSPGPAGTISASYRGSDFPIMAKMTTILDGWNFERWSYPKWTKGEVFSGNLRRHCDWFICLTYCYLHCGDTFEMRWKMHVCTVQWRNISRDTRTVKEEIITVEDGVKYFTLTSNSNMFTAKVFINLCFSKAAA